MYIFVSWSLFKVSMSRPKLSTQILVKYPLPSPFPSNSPFSFDSPPPPAPPPLPLRLPRHVLTTYREHQEQKSGQHRQSQHSLLPFHFGNHRTATKASHVSWILYQWTHEYRSTPLHDVVCTTKRKHAASIVNIHIVFFQSVSLAIQSKNRALWNAGNCYFKEVEVPWNTKIWARMHSSGCIHCDVTWCERRWRLALFRLIRVQLTWIL